MASIVSSSITEVCAAQPDGRFWVSERHDLDDGTNVAYSTLCDAGTDYEQVMRDRAEALSVQNG